ncbi:AraC family transcriptional regulator [Bradyrhizobium huanghuaihaiense]|uniref:AraC family transcriptional regulator n=1 Tax=Bradyrhizobium huanghuaihaiense TaxID=990078 RepID=A0A562RHA9_9BRAD|nr:AraC family transcriptional regulator [Bradyrhizobium huanghuaihaiense]TWI68451.1 AraC family transcriptional regulator [Bradyrhizobium huanghuaihaiense]
MDIQLDQAATATRYGLEHYGFEGVLSSSADRGWLGLSAQLCGTVRKGVIPWRTPQSDIRICFDTHGNESLVTRRAPGIESRVIARRGTVWLSPPGLQEGSVDIAEDMSGILHIHLPLSHFAPFNINIDLAAVHALSYESAFEDPLLAEIGRAISAELQAETSAGSLLIENLASSLAARLVQKCIGAPAGQPIVSRASGALDRRRLQRVLDYIETNLEGDLTLDLMASTACLSRYHFARAFKQAVGQPPHRYVSARRLDRAKALLVQGERSLMDIALALSFSDQASFTRAFRQATGQAPGQYRRELGSRQHDSSPAFIKQALMLA